MKKNFNQNKKIFKKTNVTKKHNYTSQKVSSKKPGTCVYIGNIITKDLKNTEINKILNSFLNSSPNYQNTFVTSIQVLNDYLYIFFENKNDALNASKFFDNYNFKNLKLQSYVLNSIDLNETNEEEIEDEYSFNNYYKQNSIECEILVSNRQLKKYADTINERLQKTLFGINTFITYSNNDSNEELLLSKDTLKDSFDKNLLYLIHINQTNEQYNSLNLIIFNKWRLLKTESTNHTIKENKNIPSNKAFDILKSDYRDYLDNLKEFYADSKFTHTKSELKFNEKSSDQIINKNLFDNILNKMINLPAVELKDLDFLTSYLNKQRVKLISKLKIESKVQHSITVNQNANQSSNFSQSIQQNKQMNNQQNTQSSLQQSIPSLLSQPIYFQPNLMHQSINFTSNMGNRSHQLQSLMSISSPSQVVQQQVPSLMNIQTNYNPGNHNSNNNNNKNYSNFR